MSGCDWVDQCSPECQARAQHADAIWPLFDLIPAEFKPSARTRSAQSDQLDLFAAGADDVRAFWESTHRALGIEYRRRARAYARGCPSHG